MIAVCDIHLFSSEVEDCKQGAVCHGNVAVVIVEKVPVLITTYAKEVEYK